MADSELLEILRRGADEWNEWKQKNRWGGLPDLVDADLSNAHLAGVDLSLADLVDAKLVGAELTNANLHGANLSLADLSGANLTGANLTGAACSRTNFYYANLSKADLTHANIGGASLRRTTLLGAKLSGAITIDTVFADLDLRGVEGLETIEHRGPSEVTISTIYRSEGNIPDVFLRGCGLPESIIVQIPALVGAVQPIQFYSCFISYSSKDEEFARRLHSRMREAGLRVWFAPEDIKSGQKIHEQIDRAIRLYDRLLIVLSEHSMKSEWVMTEIRRARKTEVKDHRRKLFPIRLVDYDAIKDWECFDADHGKDLAVEVREFYIPDFSNWKSHDDFEREFDRLYESLKAEN